MAKNQLDNLDSDVKDLLRRESVLKSVGEKPGNPEPLSEKKELSRKKSKL